MSLVRMAVAAMVGIAVTGPAIAQGPFDGDWYWQCEGTPEERGLTVVGDGKIVVDNIDCTILDIERIGGEGQVWRTRNACTEGDEEWVEEVLFGIERDVDGTVIQLVEVGMDDGYVLSYRTCD